MTTAKIDYRVKGFTGKIKKSQFVFNCSRFCLSCDKIEQRACWEITDDMGMYYACNGCYEMSCIYQKNKAGVTRREIIFSKEKIKRDKKIAAAKK